MSLRLMVLAATCLTPTIASAQETQTTGLEPGAGSSQTDQGATSSASGNEIVVTAQRRAEPIQRVPITITAIRGDDINGKTTTIADFAARVPGLQFNQVFQSSNPTIFLRGVGVNDYNPASSGAVGISVDDVFLNSGVGQLASVYDVDRVEVLKGPQGTLFGRNTTGGIINIYTRRPTFETSVDASLTYGKYNQLFADLGVGGAVVDDLVAARGTISFHRRDGWARNLVDGSRQNGIDSLAGRAQLLITPTPDLKLEFKAEMGRSRSSAIRAKSGGTFNFGAGRACTGEEILTITACGNPLTGFIDSADLDEYQTNVTDNYENLDTFGLRFGVDWELGAVTLTSISAYNNNRRALRQDQDMSPFAILEAPLWSDKSRQFTQEIRLTSDGDGPFRWVVGGYYLQETLDSYTDFELLRQFSPTPNAPYFDPLNFILTIGRRYRQETRSKALFAQADLEIAPQLTLTGGFRYTWDNKKLDFITVAGPVGPGNQLLQTPLIGLLDSDPASPAIDQPIRKDNDFNRPTWRLSLGWQATPNALLYASYNRGFRSGGWNTGATNAPPEFTFARAETNDAYEVGFKSNLMGRTLQLNGAAFYYDYRNMQIFTLQPGNPIPFQGLQNGDSKIYGVELQTTLRPARGVEIYAGGAYLDASYTRLDDPLNGNLAGNRIEKTPEWQLAGGANYTADLTDRLAARMAVDVNYQSTIFLSPVNRAPLVRGGYAQVNAEVGLSDEAAGWTVKLFVKNLTDERFLQDAFDVSSFGNFALVYNEPRTFGLTLTYEK